MSEQEVWIEGEKVRQVDEDMGKIRTLVREEVAKALHPEPAPEHDDQSCTICGGPLRAGHLWCPGTHEDGTLNEEDTHHVYYNNFGGIAIAANGITWMPASEALALLAWLMQERETLERLAKEGENGNGLDL